MRLLILICFTMNSAAWAREWDAHEVSLKASVEKIRTKEKDIAEKVKHKNHIKKDDPHMKQALEELTKEYKELQALYKEFEDEKQHVRFEHPDQGQKMERKYMRYKVKTLEDFENEGGIDGKLSRLKAKAMKKFGAKPSDMKSPEGPSAEEQKLLDEAAEAAKEEEKNGKRIKMVK